MLIDISNLLNKNRFRSIEEKFIIALAETNEMKNYDDAAFDFYSSLHLKSLPLVSWDIYGSYFNSVCRNYEDIVSLKRLAEDNKWSRTRRQFADVLLREGLVILVTDPRQIIVHATHNIISMNGYLPEEILGKKPNLFQGRDTCAETSKRIKEAVEKKVPFEEVILNYRKNGTTYNCWIKGEPVFDTSGELINFIAYEKEVA